MKRVITLILIVILASAALASAGQALPEYAAQTGEPCATCHVSPSGGGPRGPRGQAWVASNKPAQVPDTVQSLEILGVHLDVDQSAYQRSAGSIPPAQPLHIETVQAKQLFQWLSQQQGN
jgi:mono/diheme cytochrome c family protein